MVFADKAYSEATFNGAPVISEQLQLELAPRYALTFTHLGDE
jgi:hypothetical protein